MIYDIEKIASRFTNHTDPEPKRLQSARYIIEKKFRMAGSNVPCIPGWEKIRDFAAVYALHCRDHEEIENGREVPLPVFPPRKGLWFFGGCGTGKTFTARILSAAVRLEFYDIRDIDREYAQRGYEIFRGDSPLCKSACIIDDIGARPEADFSATRRLSNISLNTVTDSGLTAAFPPSSPPTSPTPTTSPPPTTTASAAASFTCATRFFSAPTINASRRRPQMKL